MSWFFRRPAAGGTTAVAVLMIGLSAVAPAASAQRAAVPADARTLVRQALAALEVSPPNLGVATERVIKALFAPDTRGVDMPRVRDAAQALGQEDTTAAAAYLMEALRPSEAGSPGIDKTLLVPVRWHFVPSPGSYGLLAGAVLLIAAGIAIVRR